jgi:hypothetical protein
MAREAGCDEIHVAKILAGIHFKPHALKAFEALVRADERALAAPVQEPVIPEGFSLVAVRGFDELMYWLNRCERKGYLENCPDLIEPYEAFDYRTIDTTPPAAQRQWVGLTDDAKLDMATDHFADDWAVRKALQLLDAHEAKLKEKNNG